MAPIDAPLISVIMPAYNTEQYIGEAIQSILDQTYPHFELLICDDGSTDNTYGIIQEYERNDSRIKLFRNRKNIGNLKTTNFLFNRCDGEFIAIQDSDDLSYPRRLELLAAELMANNKLACVGANYMVIDANKIPISTSLLPLSNDQIKKLLPNEVPPILWGACMFRKEVFAKTGYFKPIFKRFGFADLDLLYRICEFRECQNIKEVLYLYRSSDSHKKYPQKGIIVENGLSLIVEAHHMRMRGEQDFIDKRDLWAIRRFVGKMLFRKAEQNQWNSNFKIAQKLYVRSLLTYPFNITAAKNLIKLFLPKSNV